MYTTELVSKAPSIKREGNRTLVLTSLKRDITGRGSLVCCACKSLIHERNSPCGICPSSCGPQTESVFLDNSRPRRQISRSLKSLLTVIVFWVYRYFGISFIMHQTAHASGVLPLDGWHQWTHKPSCPTQFWSVHESSAQMTQCIE